MHKLFNEYEQIKTAYKRDQRV